MVCRIATKDNGPLSQPSSVTERAAAKKSAPHCDLEPLATSGKIALGHRAHSDWLVVDCISLSLTNTSRAS